MGYQALLFCPDEKLARVVSQVFGELDFAVEAVQEPFAAVKKLMAQRYDAVVVDCENEANASLLFKSARNSGSNQSSLAIAVVEGQVGVAKAYRIGANLVLTKPINVEQAKGTLRVARGLLRKNADAAGAASPSKTPASVFAASSFQPPNRSAETIAPPPSHSGLPQFEAPLSAMKPLAFSAASSAEFPAMTASAPASAEVEDDLADVSVPIPPVETQTKIAIAAEPAVEARQPASAGVAATDLAGDSASKSEAIKNEAAKIAAANLAPKSLSSALASATGSAAATAPAREVTAPPAPARAREKEFVQFEAANPSPTAASPFPSASAASAPSFAALGEEGSRRSGGSKKFLIAAVVLVALAALGWKLGKFATNLAPQHVSAPQSTQPVPAPAPLSAPVAAPSTSAPDRSISTTQTLTPKTAAATLPGKPPAEAANPPVIRIAANPVPEVKKPDSTPLRVKSNAGTTQGEEPAPQLPGPLAVASANDSSLNGLMAASPSLPKPALATLRISQGVSQGLLIKRVQPKYPQAALAAHTQGAVQIQAFINQEGSVVNLKVLSGDPVLARAALEAVRQWRYKPYYLDGQPVEIETQITINFKTN
ncbi:MAG: TonB family protein [Terriglobales bacterium]